MNDGSSQDSIAPGRMPGLDLLRFTAAFGVMVSHYGPYLAPHSPYFSQLGDFCVRLFFLISGIVIMRTAERSISRKVFLYRRILRLYPAFLIGFSLSILEMFVLKEKTSCLEFFGNLTMLPRLLQLPLVNGAYWTLSYEWSFYAMIALALPWLGRYQEFFILSWIGLDTALLAMVMRSPTVNILLNTHFAVLFASGMLIHRYKTGKLPIRRAILFGILMFSSYFVFIEVFNSTPLMIFVDLCEFIAIVGIAIFCTLIQFSAFSARISLAVGNASYILYLVHPPIFNVVISLCKSAKLPGFTSVIICVACAIFASFLISEYLEVPVRRLIQRFLQGINRTCEDVFVSGS